MTTSLVDKKKEPQKNEQQKCLLMLALLVQWHCRFYSVHRFSELYVRPSTHLAAGKHAKRLILHWLCGWRFPRVTSNHPGRQFVCPASRPAGPQQATLKNISLPAQPCPHPYVTSLVSGQGLLHSAPSLPPTPHPYVTSLVSGWGLSPSVPSLPPAHPRPHLIPHCWPLRMPTPGPFTQGPEIRLFGVWRPHNPYLLSWCVTKGF